MSAAPGRPKQASAPMGGSADTKCSALGAGMKRSCENLGLCQSRTPRCLACSLVEYPFAPGVIDGAPARRVARPFGFRATDMVGAIALVALAFFLAGWLL